MPPKKLRTGPGQPEHHGRTTSSPRPAARATSGAVAQPTASAEDGGRQSRMPDTPRAVESSARYTPPSRHVRVRPSWHKVVGFALLVLGLLIVLVNYAINLGGVPPWVLPGGHNEGYLVLGLVIAGASMWWFGWFDRPQ